MILGLDIARKTGAVIIDADGNLVTAKLFDFSKEKGYRRLQLMAQSVRSMVLEHRPKEAIIEDYNSRHHATLIALVEIGTVIRQELYAARVPWREVSASALKKWTTGRGDAKKPDMAVAVRNRWDFTSTSEDIVDAYALAQYGRVS